MRVVLTFLFLWCSSHVMADPARRVTDHAGHQVDVPLAPQRIVSLSDWTTTVMAHELGVPLIASVGRSDKAGGYMIRGGQELYDMAFGPDLSLASLHGAVDLERIAGLKPDLILGLKGDILPYHDQLARYAPVLLFDSANGRGMLENYADFADWLGKGAEYERLLADYNARLTTLKSQIHAAGTDLSDGDAPNYLVLRSNAASGSLTLYRDFGAVNVVMDDLGFHRPALLDEIPLHAQRADFSPEMLGMMDADYIITGHMEDRGQTAQTSLDELEAVAPGASAFLSAIRKGHFLSLSRFHISSPSFGALNYYMDALDRMDWANPG